MLAPPPLIYLVPLALGFLLHRRYPLVLPGRRVTMVLGLACILAAAIVLPALLAFRRAATRPEPWRPATSLVIDGPYRFSRNPMYVGFTLLYLGIALRYGSLWPLLFLPLVLAVMHFGVIVREEAYLERRFGDAYRQYRRRVNRWL